MTNPNHTISQRDVLSRRSPAVVGQKGSGKHVRCRTVRNLDPQRVQLATLTVGGTFAAGKKYEWTIDGVKDSYEAVAGDTDNNGVAIKIAEKINNFSFHRGLLRAKAASAIITLESLYPGIETSIIGGTDLTAAITRTADSGDDIAFGRLVLFAGQAKSQFESYNHDELNLLGRLPLGSAAGTRTIELVPIAANEGMYVAMVSIDGTVYTGTFTADADATVAEITLGLQASLAAALPATVVASDSGTAVVLTAASAGQFFDVSTSDNLERTVTVEGEFIDKLAIGVTARRDDLQAQTIAQGDPLKYPYDENMECVAEGLIAVEVDEGVTIALTDDVFVDISNDPELAGRFYNAAGANRVPFSHASWMFAANSKVAWIYIDLPR